jgi:hypothetical protein
MGVSVRTLYWIIISVGCHFEGGGECEKGEEKKRKIEKVKEKERQNEKEENGKLKLNRTKVKTKKVHVILNFVLRTGENYHFEQGEGRGEDMVSGLI